VTKRADSLPVYLVLYYAIYVLLLARYVPNVARSIWNQCNIEDRPTDDRPLFLEEPSNGQIDAWSLWTTHRKSTIASRMVMWPMTSRDPKGQGRDPIIFEAPYFDNGAR